MPALPPAAALRSPPAAGPGALPGHGGAPLLLALIAGSGLQLLQPVLWSGWIYGAFLCLALAGYALAAMQSIAHRHPWSAWALRVTAVLLAGFAVCGARAAYFAAHALDPALEGRDLVVTGTVAAMPQRNALGLRLRLDVEQAMLAGGGPVAVPPHIDLGWYVAAPPGADVLGTDGAPPDLRAGERWRLAVRLKAPHGTRNPHGFDYELWAWEQGIQATGTVRAGRRDPAPLRLDAAGWRNPVEQARQSTRDAIFLRLSPGAPEDGPADLAARRRAAGVVAALVTGDQRSIDRADWGVFRATGVAHLVSISGLHVTMFAWLAAAAVGWLWRRSAALCLRMPAQHAALVGGVLLAAAYAAFSGGGLPSQRTVCMLAVVALLRLSGRSWPWPQVWLLACAVVVAADPWALLQAGFWLSFVAVGVLFASNSGAMRPDRARAGGRFAPYLAYSTRMVREQVVVTLALTPLSLLLFGQTSAVGLLANLVAIPWVTLVVTPLSLLGTLAPPLWSAAAWAVQLLAGLLGTMAAWPHATVALPAAPAWAAAAGVAGGVLLCMRLPPLLRLLGIAPLLPVLLWQPARPTPGSFDLLAADIGQGSAVLVRTASHALLYDTGPRISADSDAGHRVLLPLLQSLGERLDAVVVSHRDSDHAGGAATVLAQQPQAALRSSIEPTHPLQQMRTVQRCEAGQQWEWDGVRFSFLHPQADDYQGPAKSNALSCVLRIEAGGRVALLAGDIEAPQEAVLVAAGAPLAADLLLAPHHGSKGSSSPGFLDAVRPKTVLVQAGYRNRFGHPAPEVLARYDARGIRAVASAACGAARWSSGAPERIDCERTSHRRYWQHAVPEPTGRPDR